MFTLNFSTGKVKHQTTVVEDHSAPSALNAAKRKSSDSQEHVVVAKKKKNQLMNGKEASLESTAVVKRDDEAVKTVRICSFEQCSRVQTVYFPNIYFLQGLFFRWRRVTSENF